MQDAPLIGYCVADSDALNCQTLGRPSTRSINIHWLINLRCSAYVYLHNATLNLWWLY